MKQYSITAKLWIKIEAETSEEAQALSKRIIDESLYEYIAVNQRLDMKTKVSMSKAKVIWAKENNEDEEEKG